MQDDPIADQEEITIAHTGAALPDHIDYDLGRRKVRFYSLTKPEVENIGRDIAAAQKNSIWLSASTATFITLIVEAFVNDFERLPPYGQAILTIGIPVSGLFLVIHGIQWLRDKRSVNRILMDRLREYDGEQGNDSE